MTDYEAPGFAGRFASARKLDRQIHHTWVLALADAAQRQRKDVVLDLGAGTGRFWPVLREAWNPRRIIAVDKSAAMFEQAEFAPDVTPVIMDIDQLPGGLGCVDACFCSMALHYSQDPYFTCLRLRELIRPGGVLCVRTGTIQTLPSFAFLRYFPSARNAEYAVMPDTEDVVGWMVEAGYTDVSSREIRTFPASGYGEYLRKVARRGFPSLQLVPEHEFYPGLLRLAGTCAANYLRHRALPMEVAMLVTGVCP